MLKIQLAVSPLLNVVWIQTLCHFKAKDMNLNMLKNKTETDFPWVDLTSGLW